MPRGRQLQNTLSLAEAAKSPARSQKCPCRADRRAAESDTSSAAFGCAVPELRTWPTRIIQWAYGSTSANGLSTRLRYRPVRSGLNERRMGMAVYALEVSPLLFELATDSLRHHSNARHALRSFDDLIVACISNMLAMDAIDDDAVRDHLQTMPADGDIHVRLTLDDASDQRLSEVREHLQGRLDIQLSLPQMISALLFVFVVERETQRVMEKMRRDRTVPPVFEQPSAKVLPFK